MDQPTLAQTAGTSITELARHKELRQPNRTEFIPALEKIIRAHTDPGTVERARRYLQEAQEGLR
jgi:hypothetical protein